jgi:hypothetical protein
MLRWRESVAISFSWCPLRLAAVSPPERRLCPATALGRVSRQIVTAVHADEDRPTADAGGGYPGL